MSQYDTLHAAHDLVDAYVRQVEEPVYPSGIKAIDHALMGGFRKKALYIVAARPGDGKSSLVLSLVRRMALEYDTASLFLSLEMSKQELTERMVAQATLRPLLELQAARQAGTLEALTARLKEQLAERWLHLEDLRGATIEDLEALWQELQEAERKPDVLVIDHLQQIPMPYGVSRADAISSYMADLKRFVKQKDIIGIICSQINREGADAPELIHLKSSGGIEENADVVFLCTRPGSEKAKTLEDKAADSEFQIHIAKHRRGPELSLILTFRPPCFEFLEPMAYGQGRHPALEVPVFEEESASTNERDTIVIP